MLIQSTLCLPPTQYSALTTHFVSLNECALACADTCGCTYFNYLPTEHAKRPGFQCVYVNITTECCLGPGFHVPNAQGNFYRLSTNPSSFSLPNDDNRNYQRRDINTNINTNTNTDSRCGKLHVAGLDSFDGEYNLGSASLDESAFASVCTQVYTKTHTGTDTNTQILFWNNDESGWCFSSTRTQADQICSRVSVSNSVMDPTTIVGT